MPKQLSEKARNKAALVMREFHRGTLHSGSGKIVTSEKQAKAIAMSEARKKALRNDIAHAVKKAVKRFRKLGYYGE